MLGLGLGLNKTLSSKLPLDDYASDLQFAYSINEQLLSSYVGNIIEVEEDGTGTKREFSPSPTMQADVLSFVGANNGNIVGIYDQKSGIKTAITVSAQQILLVNAGVWVGFTSKYNLEIPQNTSLTVSGIALCNRMKNLSLVNYIGFKGIASISGYTSDYVYPIKCNAGLMDFSVTGSTNLFWYTADGNTSTATKPAPTLVNSGNTYAFATDFLNVSCYIQGNTTGVKYIGNLKDIPRLTGKLNLAWLSNLTGDLADLGGTITDTLSLYNCALITGDLSDVGHIVTNYLSLYNCVNITGQLSNIAGNGLNYLNLYNCALIAGSLADLQGKVTSTLSLPRCTLITGSLADLQGKIGVLLNLFNCNLINGVYTPSTAGNTPSTFDLTNTGLSAANVDATLIACRSTPKNGVTFTGTGLSRTSASNTAYTELDTTYSWTFIGLA